MIKAVHFFIAISRGRLTTMNHHRFDQRGSHIHFFYLSVEKVTLTIVIALFFQILSYEGYGSSNSRSSHRSSLHFHHSVVIIAARSTISSAQRFGGHLVTRSHNIRLDSVSRGSSSRREICNEIDSVWLSLCVRCTYSNNVFSESRRSNCSKST